MVEPLNGEHLCLDLQISCLTCIKFAHDINGDVIYKTFVRRIQHYISNASFLITKIIMSEPTFQPRWRLSRQCEVSYKRIMRAHIMWHAGSGSTCVLNRKPSRIHR